MKRNAKRAMSMALAAALAFTPMTALAATDTKGHWAEKTITAWEDAGLLKGYSDGTVRPDNQITRAEFVTMMNKALKNEAVGTTAFTDVKEGDWFYGAVSAAVGAGYTKGYPDNTFKPNATITRAEAAVMIANAAGLKADEAAAAKFTDAAAIPAWAKGSIGAAVTAGYMSGYPDGSFGANKSITRAESISTLNRVMNGGQVKAEDVVVTKDDTVIENQTIEGNLVIDKAVGDGEVYVKNTEVKGDIIVQGGGDDSIYLTDVKVGGKIVMDKAGVRVQVSGKTNASAVEVKQYGAIVEKDFTGKIGTVTVTSSVKNEKAVVVDVPADKVVVDGKADVIVKADVDTVELTKNAEDAKLEVAKDAKVDKVVANAEVSITGEGKVDKLEANADGIKVDKKLEVKKVETADGVKAPVVGNVDKPSTGGGGGGGSSSSETNHKTKLKQAISAANALVKDTASSNDGSDVDAGKYWATPADIAAFQKAIDAAQAVLDKGVSSECRDAKKVLDKAQADFSAKRQQSTAVTEAMVKAALAKVEAAELKVTVGKDADQATVEAAIAAEAQKVVEAGYTVTFAATSVDTTTPGSAKVNGTFSVAHEKYNSGTAVAGTAKDVAITVDAKAQLKGDLKITGAAKDVAVAGEKLTATVTVDGLDKDFVFAWAGAGDVKDTAEYTVVDGDINKEVTVTVTHPERFGELTAKIRVANNDASVSEVKVNEVVVAANKDDATKYTVDVAAADFDKVTKDVVTVTATDAAHATVGAVTEAPDQTTPEKKVFTVEVTAEDGTTKVTYTITANKVKNDVKATVTDLAIKGETGVALPADQNVTITLANGTFKGVAVDDNVAAWFTGLPTGMTAKVKTVADGEATITLGGTVANAITANVTVAVPVANIELAADTNEPAAAVQATGTITVNVESKAKQELQAEIEKAKQKKDGVKISENGSDVPTSEKWVTESAMNDFTQAIAKAEAVYNTTVEDKDYTAAKDLLVEAAGKFNPTAGSQAVVQDVAATADKEEFTFKANEEITADTKAVITVTGATAVAADQVTITPKDETNGITAAVTAGDTQNTLKVTFSGTPTQKAAVQAYTVAIPADAITVDDTHTAKALEVKLNVTVDDAQQAQTIDVENVAIKAADDTVKVELGSSKKFATDITSHAEYFTLEDQAADAKKTVRVKTVELDQTEAIAYLTIDNGSDAAVEAVDNATLKIDPKAFAAQDVVTGDITATVGVAVTASATAGDTVDATFGTEITGKTTTITLVGGTVAAKDGITATATNANGVTATVADISSASSAITINWSGTPATNTDARTFTVTIPADKITSTGIVKGDVTVDVTVTVAKGDVDAITIKGLTAPAKDATPVAADALSTGAANYTISGIEWQDNSTGDFAATSDATFQSKKTYRAVITVAPAANYQIKTAAFADANGVTVNSDETTATTGTKSIVGTAAENEVKIAVEFAELA